MIRFIAVAIIASALAGCGADAPVRTTYVAVEPIRPQAPAECTMPDPMFPKLPNADVDDDAATRDRIAITRRDREIARRRAVCRVWLEQHELAEPRRAAKSS